MSDSDEASRLFRVQKTLVKMLKDRGYAVAQDTELDWTMDQFKAKYVDTITGSVNRKGLTLQGEKPGATENDDQELIIVFFPEAPKVGVNDIKTCAEQMKAEKAQRGIIVIRESMTAFARQSLAETEKSKLHIEQFNESELLVNITEHSLVPKHEILSDAEKKQLLDRYHVQPHQLPRIQMSDPVARYYGLRRGQVMRIIRISETAGKYVTYRLCI